jgi:tRNA dimethylallyltransferase
VKQKRLIVIVGPTASGKTTLALRLARDNQGAVVSADSRQVYVGMNIGTATPLRSAVEHKPHDILTPDVVDGIEHYLLNIREPDQPLTLAEWQHAAFTVIDTLVSHERTPLLVGGTMLYIDSVIYNFSIPHVPPQAQLREQLSRREAGELYAELIKRDPAASHFIEPHHTRRIIRALEVMMASGKRFSELRQRGEPRYETEIIGLFPGWEALERAIRARAHQMVREGLMEEIESLRNRYGADLVLLQTVNYKEAPDIEAMVRANMRYARRQMAWWRGRKDVTWLSDSETILPDVGIR